MTKEMSIGRWRGMKACSTDNDAFAILAFDQRGSYRKMLPDNTDFATASRVKSEVVTAISPYATAILLDPIYGLESAIHMSGHSGMLIAIEKTGYSGEATSRRIDFIDGWNVAKIKEMGASAVKILVYYHPDAGEATEHIEETIRQIASEAHRRDLPFFVEPVTYSPDASIPKNSEAYAEKRPAIIRRTVERLQNCGADVLKVEFPVDAAFNTDENMWRDACESISEIATIPWALLSAGVEFPVFEKQVTIASKSGATGFLGGRAIWKEAISMSDAERAVFLNTTARERMQTLRGIVSEYAKPWTVYYHPMPAPEGWYLQYAAE